MRFLVRIVVKLPGEWLPERKEEIRLQERERAVELMRQGTLRRMFRIAGETGNYGIWHADTLEELHAALASLPMFPWMSTTVIPTIPHPAEQAYEAAHGELPAP